MNFRAVPGYARRHIAKYHLTVQSAPKYCELNCGVDPIPRQEMRLQLWILSADAERILPTELFVEVDKVLWRDPGQSHEIRGGMVRCSLSGAGVGEKTAQG